MERMKNLSNYSYNMLQLINRTDISNYLEKTEDELNDFFEKNKQFIFDAISIKIINVSNNKKYSLFEFATLFNNDNIDTFNNELENNKYIDRMNRLHYIFSYKIYGFYDDFKIYSIILGLPFIYFYNFKVWLVFIFGSIYLSYDYFIKSNKISYKAEKFFGPAQVWLDNPKLYEWKKYFFLLLFLIMIIILHHDSYFYLGFSLFVFFGINLLNFQLAKFQNSVSYKSKILGQNFSK